MEREKVKRRKRKIERERIEERDREKIEGLERILLERIQIAKLPKQCIEYYMGCNKKE